jgi:hypothetical protein
MASIASDEDVCAQFKEESRKQYVRMWSQRFYFCQAVKLQDFPRLTMLIKSYDTDIKGKANI